MVVLPLKVPSLDTHRREVFGVYGTLSTDTRRKPHVNCAKKAEGSSAPVITESGGPESPLQPDSRNNPNVIVY